MEIAMVKNGIFISQKKYTLDVQKEIGKLGCKLAGTPQTEIGSIKLPKRIHQLKERDINTLWGN